jgi:hypothetical protein
MDTDGDSNDERENTGREGNDGGKVVRIPAVRKLIGTALVRKLSD